MVRLKDSWYKELWRSNFISIPYGAIKSKKINIMKTTVKEISIPYGAIKRARLDKELWFET